MNTPNAAPALFREIQRFTQVWVWILVLLVTILSWYGAIQQLVMKKPFGSNPAPDSLMLIIWVIFGVGFPYFFGSIRLLTEVHKNRICIRFFPLHRRFLCFDFKDIVEYKTVSYRPIRDFGGWGIRFGANTKVYNVQGNQGVELVLKNKTRILIGSQRAEQIVAAVDAAIPK